MTKLNRNKQKKPSFDQCFMITNTHIFLKQHVTIFEMLCKMGAGNTKQTVKIIGSSHSFLVDPFIIVCQQPT